MVIVPEWNGNISEGLNIRRVRPKPGLKFAIQPETTSNTRLTQGMSQIVDLSTVADFSAKSLSSRRGKVTATGAFSFTPRSQPWGPDALKDTKDEPDEEIMQNGLEQFQEMIARNRTHPSILSWGLCNEINGQDPPAYTLRGECTMKPRDLIPGDCVLVRRIRCSAIPKMTSRSPWTA